VRELEVLLRDLVTAYYDCDPEKNKKPFAGVGIRVGTLYTYKHEDAFEWAVEHKAALQLDRKAFEQVCKTDLKPGFVTVQEVPTATIATDLSAALKEVTP
jgi:hypothetical protein